MARWYGAVGFSTVSETQPGIWTEAITERNYYGDIVRNTRQLQYGDRINANPDISNSISIVADPYADENFHAIRYVIFMGTRWIVTGVEVQYPRLVLSLGGVYNGQQS